MEYFPYSRLPDLFLEGLSLLQFWGCSQTLMPRILPWPVKRHAVPSSDSNKKYNAVGSLQWDRVTQTKEQCELYLTVKQDIHYLKENVNSSPLLAVFVLSQCQFYTKTETTVDRVRLAACLCLVELFYQIIVNNSQQNLKKNSCV